ncbi:hypothetical protein [Frankia gtarii]|nr:hypothetical protein [Frankia gtarii]
MAGEIDDIPRVHPAGRASGKAEPGGVRAGESRASAFPRPG